MQTPIDKPRSVNTRAIDYMTDKYGDNFVFSAPYGDSFSGTRQLLVKSDKFPDENILVEIENYSREERVYSDNYAAVKYKPEVIDFLTSCAVKVFGEATVFYYIARQALKALPIDATFEEFMAYTDVPLHITVEIKASDLKSEAQARELADEIARYGTHFLLSLVAVRDAEYGAFDAETIERQKVIGNYFKFAHISKFDGAANISWQGRE